MDAFVGKWNLVESDNFDAYLKEIGVGFATRKIAGVLKPTLEFVKEGDQWVMTSISTFKTHATKFKLDEELDTETIDGRQMRSTFSWTDGKLVQEEKPKDASGKTSHFERFVEDGKLVVICECGGVKCRRVYEKAA